MSGTNEKIRLGFLGGGESSMIGILHRIAAYMFDRFEIVGGVLGSTRNDHLNFGKKIGIAPERIYTDIDEMIRSEVKLPEQDRMQVVSILTPNFLHYPMAKSLLENGFHVICEKPLTTTYEQALDLKKILTLTNSIFAVTYTYIGYPMVRQLKKMIEEGELGKIQKIDVQYYQGWINPVIHDPEKRAGTWRLQPELSGISCCLGDIGTHAFQMIEYTTDLKIYQVLADLNYLYEDNQMDIDGTVLFRTSDGVKGIIRASQIATGEENSFIVRIYGEKAGAIWEQENPNYLKVMREGLPAEILKPGNQYNSDFSNDGTKLPPGHPEGIFDAMGNIYRGVARAIAGEDPEAGEFPTISDGIRGMNFIESAIASHMKGNVWKALAEDAI
jgi:predicted dehydrogenase